MSTPLGAHIITLCTFIMYMTSRVHLMAVSVRHVRYERMV